MKILRHNHGFSIVEFFFVAIIAFVLIGLGFFLEDKTRMAARAAEARQIRTTASGSIVTSLDGKVQLNLPSTWKTDSQYVYGLKPLINAGVRSHCIAANDPSPCLYQVSLLPAGIADGSYGELSDHSSIVAGDSWSLVVEKTTLPLQKVISIIGSFSPADIIAQNDNPINGYSAHFIKGYYGVPHIAQSGMAFYIIEYNGYLAVFEERLLPINKHPNPATLTSSNDSDFAKIAQSLKFNF